MVRTFVASQARPLPERPPLLDAPRPPLEEAPPYQLPFVQGRDDHRLRACEGQNN
jgi:hypothetical protein